MASHSELLNEVEWRKCHGSSEEDVDAFIYWAEHYAFIQHPARGAILIPLREAQVEVITVWMTERRSIVLKARQIGYSTLLGLYSLWLCFFYPDRLIVLLSQTERKAVDLLAKADYAFKRMPEWMRIRGPKRLDRTVTKISFDNSSKVESLPSKEDPARGSSVTLIAVDEWAFLDNPEAAWASIEPVADVGGRIIGLSTANGAGTFFHNFWVRAVTGDSGFRPMFYPWHANTERDAGWYEAKKASLLPWQLAQEYPESPEEAFIRSGNPVFDTDHLRTLQVTPPLSSGYLSGSSPADALWVPALNGSIDIWRMPDSEDAYVIGADVAEGLATGDYSVAHVISHLNGDVVAEYRAHVDADEFGVELAKLGFFYRRAYIGCEVNNHGLTTNKSLQRCGYPFIYARHELDHRTGHQPLQSKVGWLTTRTSKPLMIDNLATALKADLKIAGQGTLGELLNYARNDKGQMSGAPHDDRVMSLAIANQMRPFAVRKTVAEKPDIYWTWEYFAKKVRPPEPGVRPMMGIHNTR